MLKFHALRFLNTVLTFSGVEYFMLISGMHNTFPESSVPHIIPTSGTTERGGVGTGRTQQQSRLNENNTFDQSEVQSWRRPPSLRRPNSNIDDKSECWGTECEGGREREVERSFGREEY